MVKPTLFLLLAVVSAASEATAPEGSLLQIMLMLLLPLLQPPLPRTNFACRRKIWNPVYPCVRLTVFLARRHVGLFEKSAPAGTLAFNSLRYYSSLGQGALFSTEPESKMLLALASFCHRLRAAAWELIHCHLLFPCPSMDLLLSGWGRFWQSFPAKDYSRP